MSEVSLISIVISVSVLISQSLAIESTELQRLQSDAAAENDRNNALADPNAWDI